MPQGKIYRHIKQKISLTRKASKNYWCFIINLIMTIDFICYYRNNNSNRKEILIAKLLSSKDDQNRIIKQGEKPFKIQTKM